MADKVLSGITEKAKGFVGSRPRPIFDQTQNKRARVVFSLGCGVPDQNHGKYPTWRRCVGYGEIADSLFGVKVGDFVHASGWLQTEALRDQSNMIQKDINGYPITRDTLILENAYIEKYARKEKVQPELIPK